MIVEEGPGRATEDLDPRIDARAETRRAGMVDPGAINKIFIPCVSCICFIDLLSALFQCNALFQFHDSFR